MITYRCTHCKRPLEVDDELGGKQAACPHCRQIQVVPKAPERINGVPVARPAGTGGGGGNGNAAAGGVPIEDDRAMAMGLPPDAGPEEHVLTVHPAPLRARPMHAIAILVLIVGGLVGAGFAVFSAGSLAWLLIPGCAAAIIGAFWWACHAIGARGTALVITNKRTTERRGWLRRATKEILHDKVQDIQVTQSFPQRMLGVGTVGISNAGETGVEIEVHDLPNPRHIRDVIDAYRNLG